MREPSGFRGSLVAPQSPTSCTSVAGYSWDPSWSATRSGPCRVGGESCPRAAARALARRADHRTAAARPHTAPRRCVESKSGINLPSRGTEMDVHFSSPMVSRLRNETAKSANVVQSCFRGKVYEMRPLAYIHDHWRPTPEGVFAHSRYDTLSTSRPIQRCVAFNLSQAPVLHLAASTQPQSTYEYQTDHCRRGAA